MSTQDDKTHPDDFGVKDWSRPRRVLNTRIATAALAAALVALLASLAVLARNTQRDATRALDERFETRASFTVGLENDSDPSLATLLNALGPDRANPYHGRQRRGRS